MSRSRVALATIIAAVLLASCGNPPGLTVSVAGQRVATQVLGHTERMPCSTSHGDGPYIPRLTSVRAVLPLTIRFEAGQLATEIRGWIYDADAPAPSGGAPIEEFRLLSRGGAYESRSILPARTYEIVVNVIWSEFLTRGEVTHLFRVRVEPP